MSIHLQQTANFCLIYLPFLTHHHIDTEYQYNFMLLCSHAHISRIFSSDITINHIKSIKRTENGMIKAQIHKYCEFLMLSTSDNSIQ